MCKHKSTAFVHYDTFVFADLSIALFALLWCHVKWTARLRRSTSSVLVAFDPLANSMQSQCCYVNFPVIFREIFFLAKRLNNFYALSEKKSWEMRNVSNEWKVGQRFFITCLQHVNIDAGLHCTDPNLLCAMNHHDMIHHESRKSGGKWRSENKKMTLIWGGFGNDVLFPPLSC